MDFNMTDNVVNINMPYNLEAEQSVLGIILMEPSLVPKAMELLKPDYFYRDQHRSIFAVILRMFTSGQPVDVITVLDEVMHENVFDSIESAKVYLVNLMQMVPTTSNFEVYCHIVEDKYYIRSLVNVARDVIASASDGQEDAKALLDNAEQRIFSIRQGRDASGLTPIEEVIIESYDRLQKLSSDDKEQYLGIPSGFKGLDALLTGLNKSDLILIAARPGMGKTSFALNLVDNVGRKGYQVAFFSLEMSKEQLVNKMLSSDGRIPSYNLRTGMLSPDEWVRLASAAELLARSPIYFDDTPGMSVAEMKAKLRRLKNLGLVVIDYLQLMSSGRRIENRVAEISEITRNLKIMAKELNVPVITLSQLSRGPEARSDHRPMLSDLRESGSIEQDADIVMFLYRDAYYNREAEEQNLAECIVAKNRHGEAGTVNLIWDGQYTLFSDPEMFRTE